MAIKYQKSKCDACGMDIRFELTEIGKTGKCPRCGQETKLHVPTRSEHKGPSILVTAIVGAVASVICIRLADCWFPHPTNVVSQPAPSHLGQIRQDYPALAFSVACTGKEEPERYGFLGLGKAPRRWIYELRVANLSATSIDRIEITVRFPKDVVWFQLIEHKEILDSLSQEFTDETAISKRNAQHFSFFLTELKARMSRKIKFQLYDNERIPTDELVIHVQCPEGQFIQITPLQFENIGWEKH